MILRCFVSQNVNLLVRVFVVYVRPLLEYNSSLWSPSLKRDVTLIEQVQRRFTKRLRGYRDLPYHERLNKLNSKTLDLRRVKSDLVLCYKIVFDIVHFFCERVVNIWNRLPVDTTNLVLFIVLEIHRRHDTC